MDEIRVVVSGTGKMGSLIAQAIAEAEGMAPVGFVDGLATVGKLGHLPVFTDPVLCIQERKPDVIIDFTNAAWTPTLADAALDAGVRMVIGTTGLPNSWIGELGQRAQAAGVGCILAANFSLGAVLMMGFAKQAARWFEAAEIIELHHDQKVDSPSGTAKTTAELMRSAREGNFRHRVSDKETVPGARGAELGGIAIHSVRLPGFMASQEVIFGGVGQTLTIRHDSTRESYMPGIVLATREVMALNGLTIGLEPFLGLS